LSFSVPYLWDTPYRPTSPPVAALRYPLLRIQLVSTIVGMDPLVDPFVHMVLWRSAGEDFQFNQYIEPTWFITGQAPPPAEMLVTEAQSNPVLVFQDKFPPILGNCVSSVESGFISPEKVTTFNELWHRYSNGFPYSPGISPGPHQFYYWANIFKHWRGSLRYVHNNLQNSTTQFILTNSQPQSVNKGPGMGNAFTNNSFATIYLEIPYYSTNAFQLCQNNGVGYLTPRALLEQWPTTVEYDPSDVYISGGDDFSYGYLYSPDVWATAPQNPVV